MLNIKKIQNLFSVSLCLSLCLFVALSVSLSLSRSLCLALSVSRSLSRALCLEIFFSLSISRSLCLALSVSLSLSLSLCLALSVSLSPSLALSPNGFRGPLHGICIFVYRPHAFYIKWLIINSCAFVDDLFQKLPFYSSIQVTKLSVLLYVRRCYSI